MSTRSLTGLLLVGLLWSGQAAAHPPYGLVVDARGNVYFSDLETVWRLKPDGQIEVFRAGVADTHVHELAMAPDGAIEGDQNQYDPQTQRFYSGLWRRTLAGSERFLVPMTERAPAGFGVWQDSSGNRYASYWPSNDDRRTMLNWRNPEGRGRLLFAEGTPSREPQRTVGSVGGMAFDASRSVYFADRNLLREIVPGGKGRVLYKGTERSSLRGLAKSQDGRVLAADMGTKSVLAINPNGHSETLYREAGAWLPTAVAQVSGRLLVLEANADHLEYDDRVRVVEVVNGRPNVVAQPGAQETAARPTSDSKRPTSRKSTSVAVVIASAITAAGIAMFFAYRKGA